MTKQLVVMSLLVSALLTASSSLAQSPSAAMKSERMESSCEKVMTNVKGMATSAEARVSAREAFVTKWRTQVADRIQKLKSKGADVTKLTNDATQLGTLLEIWLADYKTYVANLQTTQQYDCTTTRDKFKTALQTVRTAHKKVQTDRKSIMELITKTLIPDFKAARATITNSSPTP